MANGEAEHVQVVVDMTKLVEDVAKAQWDRSSASLGDKARKWEELGPELKHRIKSDMVPIVHIVIKALEKQTNNED